jgi:hypothetical protein
MFVVLKHICVKFNFNYFGVAAASVLIIQLISIQYERKYALVYVHRVPRVPCPVSNGGHLEHQQNRLMAVPYRSLCLLSAGLHVL